MSYFTFWKKTVDGGVESSQKEDIQVPTQPNQVLGYNGYQTSSQFKAYTSIQWKSNTQIMTMVQNEWRPILTNAVPTKGIDSGHCNIESLGGGDYQYRYTDPDGLSRKFLCNMNFGIDMRDQATSKTIEFRLLYNGFPLSPFLQIESAKEESASSSVLLELNNNDYVDCEIRNVSDNNALLVRYFNIVVTEI